MLNLTHRCARRAVPSTLAAVSMLFAAGEGTAQTGTYLDHAGLTAELRSIIGGSNLAGMSSIATTLGGREVWVVEIADRSGAALDERPALLVVANLEGDHLVGSSHAVEMVRYLIDNAGDADVRALLDEQVVYVIPRLNPDGAEAFFASVRWDRRGNAAPYDDDNDGRVDEDGPNDLNGDGVISVMRVPDPSGPYMLDPDDPRLLRRADPAKGETGAYSVHWEGTDDDGDGFINEDGPGGTDLNRNFQHEYPYWQADAGVHMVSERESRGLLDFMIAHRNIGAIVAFGHTDNLVTPPNSGGNLAGPSVLDLVAFADASNADVYEVGVFGGGGGGGGFGGFGGFGFGGGGQFRGAQLGANNDPSSGRRPSTTVHQADQEYFGTVSEAYREITGIESVGIHRRPAGAFFEWGYFQFGIPSFSTQGWSPVAGEDDAGDEAEAGGAAGDAAAGRPGRGGAGGAASQARGGSGGGDGADAEILAGLEAAGVDAFVDWSAHAHATLGDVEIGGFQPYVTTNPPAADLADLGERHGRFLVRLAGMLPRVRIVDTSVTAHGGGLFTVEADIENAGYLPTSLQHGVVSRSVQPTTVQIQVDPDDVITGSSKTETIQRLEGSGTRESFSWVIRGQAGAQVEIRVRSQKGGTHSATVTLG